MAQAFGELGEILMSESERKAFLKRSIYGTVRQERESRNG